MSGKPLTKEEWNACVYHVAKLLPTAEGELFDKILSDHTYWREAVKNAAEYSDTGPSAGMCITCNFCNENDTQTSLVSGDGVIKHKPDCPWKLAQ